MVQKKTYYVGTTRFDISKYLVIGENEIELTIVNNLRNLMGPLHLKIETYAAGPYSFIRRTVFGTLRRKICGMKIIALLR